MLTRFAGRLIFQKLSSRVHSGRRLFSQMISNPLKFRLNEEIEDLPVEVGKLEEAQNKFNVRNKGAFGQAIMHDQSKVVAIYSPEGFGKTYNMSEVRSVIRGQYQEISLSLDGVDGKTFEEAYGVLQERIINLYDKYRYLSGSYKLSEKQKLFFKTVLAGKANRFQLENALRNLIECLYAYHGVKVCLFIDDYDYPIEAGYKNQYYEEIFEVIRNLIRTALRSNSDIEKAVIMGEIMVAEEKLFFGTNDIGSYFFPSPEPWSERYKPFFGMTKIEVNKLFKNFGVRNIKLVEDQLFYKNNKVYSSLSIMNSAKKQGTIEPFRIKRNDHQLMGDLIRKAPLNIKKELAWLLQGKSIEKYIDEGELFRNLDQHNNIWTFLLRKGYLELTDCRYTEQGKLAILVIPNSQVRGLYRVVIEQWLSNEQGAGWYNEFLNALLSNNISEWKKYLTLMILQVAKFHDEKTQPEAFFYGLVLGLTASLKESRYEVDAWSSINNNQCFFISLISEDKKQNINIKLKAAAEGEQLTLAAKDAMSFSSEKMKPEAMNTINVGIGFRGKYLVVETPENRSAFGFMMSR